MRQTLKPAAWLSAPLTTLFCDPDGYAEVAYIEFRTGAVCRVEHPDPDDPVFLYIGDDDLPVGVKLTAPISVEMQGRIRSYLHGDADGRDVGTDRSVTRAWKSIPPALVEPTLRQVAQASRNLEPGG